MMTKADQKAVSGGFTTVVTSAHRGRTLRSVYVQFPHVAPPGVDFRAEHDGRHFEMTSFQGRPVELYMRNPEGLYMYLGNVRNYAAGAELIQAFRAAWYGEQPSKAARDAFEASASERIA